MNLRRIAVTVTAVTLAGMALACSGATSKSPASANGGLTATGRSTGSAPKDPSSPADAPGSFGEGTFAVGSDIPAGTYQAAVPDDSSGCYWEVTKDDTGSLDSIIANDNLNAGAHGLVVLAAKQFVKTNGCGRWSPATKPATPSKKLTEGTFRVGVDIAAGTYTAQVPGDSSGCYWQTSRDGTGKLSSVIANDNLDPGAHARVTVKTGQWFKTDGCGAWSSQ